VRLLVADRRPAVGLGQLTSSELEAFVQQVAARVSRATLQHVVASAELPAVAGRTGRSAERVGEPDRYEVSFTRFFYKPQRLRTLEEIRADIRALEKETEALLGEIVGGVAP
jgi:hypothetical protein